MMMNKIAVALAVMSVSFGAQALPITIDLFGGSGGLVQDTTADAAAVVASQVDANIIGTERDLSSNLSSFSGTSGDVTSEVGNGFYSFSVNSGSKGTGIIQWDGIDTSPILAFGLGGGAGVDLTDSLTNLMIEMVVNQADAGFQFWIEAYTDSTNYSRIKLLSNQVDSTGQFINPGEPHLIPLAGFYACSAPADPSIGYLDTECVGTFDITHVRAIQVIIDPLAQAGALDLTLDQVRVVPEPASLALAGLGLLGLGALRRRKQT